MLERPGMRGRSTPRAATGLGRGGERFARVLAERASTAAAEELAAALALCSPRPVQALVESVEPAARSASATPERDPQPGRVGTAGAVDCSVRGEWEGRLDIRAELTRVGVSLGIEVPPGLAAEQRALAGEVREIAERRRVRVAEVRVARAPVARGGRAHG